MTLQKSNVDLAQAVASLEALCLSQKQVACPVYHHFSPGIYIREVNIPANTISIGHRQKTEHLNIFLKGKVLFLEPDGRTSVLTAPMIFTSPPGRKVGYILEDMVWLNAYPTTETNVEVLEDTYLDKSDTWKQESIKGLTDISVLEDQGDYLQMLKEFNIDEDFVRQSSERTEDCIDFPYGVYSLGVFDSKRQGKGIFATADFNVGDLIAPALICQKRTPLGRYTNHSKNPNVKPHRVNADIYFVAIKPIKGNYGGFTGDEITVNYRDVLNIGR